MKALRLVLLVSICLFTNLSIAQNWNNLAKKDLELLSQSFDSIKKNLDSEKEKLNTLKLELNGTSDKSDFSKLQNVIKLLKELKGKLDSVYLKQLHFKTYYETKNVSADSLSRYFKHEYTIEANVIENNDSTNPKTYLYFGKDKIIEEKTLFNKERENQIFSEILSAKSESYLGDFIIPQNDQLIYGQLSEKRIKEDTLEKHGVELTKKELKNISKKIKFRFEKIKIELVEGGLNDIKLYVKDEAGNQLLFENRIPVSLLSYTKNSSRNRLSFSLISSNNKETALNREAYIGSYINLADVLLYIPNPGQNYVPDDLTLEFPTKTNGESENTNQAINYKVIQNTSLQNVLELRTYTDFLALFGESANGIVQLEANATFFIAPFNIGNSSVYMMKKITPYVNFSRLDENERFVDLTQQTDGMYNINHSLDIIEKSYLEMGMRLDVFSFKLTKEFPFTTNIFLPINYRIADIKPDDLTEKSNYKTFGVGAGIRLEFKKFNNFGFNYSAEITHYESSQFNTIEHLNNVSNFWVFRNEAEIYFFPGESKTQSIFLRFRAFNNSNKGNKEAFYQLQFGYKFSLGISKLKK